MVAAFLAPWLSSRVFEPPCPHHCHRPSNVTPSEGLSLGRTQQPPVPPVPALPALWEAWRWWNVLAANLPAVLPSPSWSWLRSDTGTPTKWLTEPEMFCRARYDQKRANVPTDALIRFIFWVFRGRSFEARGGAIGRFCARPLRMMVCMQCNGM